MTSLLRTTSAILLVASTTAYAGGISRTDQSIELLFEEGNVAEFSLGYVMPNISDDATGLEMADDYLLTSGGIKMDYGSISAALIFDQPFGALVAYPIGHPYNPVEADLRVSNITALVSYNVTENIEVFGGIAAQTTSANAILSPLGVVDVSQGTGFGYVLGAAYQIPEYALRVSLTYRSEVTSTHSTQINLAASPDTEFTTPQSINLEAQTGINPKTLIFGSVRWTNYDAIDITISGFATIIDYTRDVYSYELGVGRKLTDSLSAAVSVGYEAPDGDEASPLAPTDGRTSLGAALIYTMDNMEITGGVRYVWLGDTFTTPGPLTFSGNNALAVGLSMKYSF